MHSIRHITQLDDIKIVANLAHHIWNHHFVPIIGQGQVDYMLDKFQSEEAITSQIASGYEYFLLSDNNKNCGYLSILPDPEQQKMMISKVYIDHKVRGLGHGTFLLDFVKNLCQERGIGKIWLTVNRYNHDTIAWYKRKGFMVTEEKKMDIGNGYFMDDYIMELALSSVS